MRRRMSGHERRGQTQRIQRRRPPALCHGRYIYGPPTHRRPVGALPDTATRARPHAASVEGRLPRELGLCGSHASRACADSKKGRRCSPSRDRLAVCGCAPVLWTPGRAVEFRIRRCACAQRCNSDVSFWGGGGACNGTLPGATCTKDIAPYDGAAPEGGCSGPIPSLAAPPRPGTCGECSDR